MYRAFNTLGISCNWILHAPRMSFRRYCKTTRLLALMSKRQNYKSHPGLNYNYL
jgi:hypothetical protein